MVVEKERKMSQLREGMRARKLGIPSMRRAGFGGFLGAGGAFVAGGADGGIAEAWGEEEGAGGFVASAIALARPELPGDNEDQV